MSKVGIVAGGGFQGQALLDQLDATGAETVVFDVLAENINMYAATYRLLPPLTSTDFLPTLLQQCEILDVRTVFPATAREQSLLASNRALLAQHGVDAAVSDAELLTAISDKRTVKDWLARHGLPVLEHAENPTSFPVIVKPRAGWGGRGVLVIRSTEELAAFKATEEFSSFICERFLPEFEEFSVDFSIRPDAAISPLIIRRRDRVSGGFAVVSTTTADTALHHVADTLARELAASGARGIFCVQLLRTSEGEVVVSDLNPRIGTSASAGLTSGVNIVAFYLGAPAGTRAPVPMRAVRRLTTTGYPLLEALPIRGVVFDLDDTLLDHERWILERFDNACLALGYDPELAADVHEAACLFVEGKNWGTLVDDVAEYCGFEASSRLELLNAYRSAIGTSTSSIRGSRETVASIEAAGYQVAVLTNNSASAAAAKMKALGLADTPVIAVTGFHSKPAASAFVAAAEALGIEVSKLLMVGDDGFRDGVGALRAGFAAAAIVPGPRGSRSRSYRDALGSNEKARCFELDSVRALPALLSDR